MGELETMEMTIEQAEKLINYIDFNKFIEVVKNQPIKGHVSAESLESLKKLDIKVIYSEKKRWSGYFKTKLTELLNNSPNPNAEIERELNRIAVFLLQKEKSISSISNRGWFFNFPLLGKIWANSESLKLYKDELLKIQRKKRQPKRIRPTSFNWKGTPGQLEKLYKELAQIDRPIIKCTIKTFKRAFNGAEIKVNLGIVWLVIAKNKHTSKSSLFHFIRLIENQDLIKQDQDVLNNRIRNIFVDAEGRGLINIKQAKFNESDKPARADDIEQAVQAIYST